mgnify:CR=1 FL=1
MTRSTLGQSIDSALSAWSELVDDGPTGPGIDFSETNRTRRCRARVDEFLDDSSKESFRALWCGETLASYWEPSPAMLLNADDAVESLATVLSEMRTGDEFDPAWEGRFGENIVPWGLYELHGRLQGGHEPIPSSEARTVLGELGHESGATRESVIEAIESFRERYEARVGHVSAGKPCELPIYAEIDEFFKLVETTDRETVSAQLTGPYASLFRPLIGYRFRTESAAEIEWDGVDALITDHVEARDSGAYDDLETAHWGGTHIESWKWQFEAYFQDVVKKEFDLTSLDPEDVPSFFDALEDPDTEFDVVSNVPAKMMGGRFHRLTWDDIVARCRDNPDEAAVVLSRLFDEEVAIVERLDEFYEFCRPLTDRAENERSPGSLLRAATTLLMYAYPQRHLAFQYQRLDDFFSTYATVDGVDTGFNARQYQEVAIACRDLLERIAAVTDDASMIDVQTLIYVANDA